MVDTENPVFINCEDHGRRVGGVICCHVHGENSPDRQFLENRSDPDDLQGWCDLCEQKFRDEGGMTPTFLEFNDAKLVCDIHYRMFRDRLPRLEIDSA
jgi:hypothetical protein